MVEEILCENSEQLNIQVELSPDGANRLSVKCSRSEDISRLKENV